MKEKILSLSERALKHFGADEQRLKLAEECAELIVAIHHHRAPASEYRVGTETRLAEELADVLILSEQLMTDPDFEAKVKAEYYSKMRRLLKRLDEAEERRSEGSSIKCLHCDEVWNSGGHVCKPEGGQ